MYLFRHQSLQGRNNFLSPRVLGAIGPNGSDLLPVEFRSVSAVTAYGSRTNTTIAAPASIETNDRLIAALLVAKASASPSVTPPNGWTELAESPLSVNDGSFFGKLHVYEKVATASEGSDYTFTHASASSEGVIIAFSGPKASGPLGTVTGNTRTGTAAVATGLVTYQNNSIALYIAHGWEAKAKTPPTGWTEKAEGTLVYLAILDVPVADEVSLATNAVNDSSIPNSAFMIAITPSGVIPTLSFPDATNTGSSGVLTPYSGTLTTTANNQVIEDLEITGKIVVAHNNVTIQNCTITTTEAIAIDVSGTDCLIQDCTIDGSGVADNGIIGGPGTLIYRCDISNAENGIVIGGNNMVIQDNYIHDLDSDAGTPHYDGIQGNGGFTSLIIRHNAIYSFDTSCIILQNISAGFGGVVIENNLLNMTSGATHIYLRGDKASGEPITDATVQNNRFTGTSSAYYDLTSGPVSLTWYKNTNELGELIEV